MLFLLAAVLLAGTALLYLSDRQQRALAQPLPAAARRASLSLSAFFVHEGKSSPFTASGGVDSCQPEGLDSRC